MNIKIINVSKFFGTRKVLDNVNFDINIGNFIALVGDSGAGKTTFMSIANTLMKPSEGSVYYTGKLFSKMSRMERNALRKDRISMILQQPAYFKNISVKDNVLVPYYLGRSMNKNVKELFEEYIVEFGLKDKQKYLPGQLSGGEIRKMILLRSVLKPMEILFADEPTADLDSHSTEHVIKLFTRLNKEGKTIILATHNQALAKSAKDIYKMQDGKLSC